METHITRLYCTTVRSSALDRIRLALALISLASGNGLEIAAMAICIAIFL